MKPESTINFLPEQQWHRLQQVCRFLERDFQRQGLGERLIEDVISYYCPCCKKRSLREQHKPKCLVPKIMRVLKSQQRQELSTQDIIDICKAMLKMRLVAAYAHLSVFAAEILILVSQKEPVWHEML
jgi:GNAT superfamily N-acetyltransferase